MQEDKRTNLVPGLLGLIVKWERQKVVNMINVRKSVGLSRTYDRGSDLIFRVQECFSEEVPLK